MLSYRALQNSASFGGIVGPRLQSQGTLLQILMCGISSDFFRGTSDTCVISALTTSLLNFTGEEQVPSANSGWSLLAIGLGLQGLPG